MSTYDTITKSLLDYCKFDDPSLVYILILLPRKKENKEQSEREKLKKRTRFILQTEDDIPFAVNDFIEYAKLHSDTVFRVYVSVNRRSLLKGLFNFQLKLNRFTHDLINGNDEVYTSIAKLGSEFKSVLARKESRHERYYLFDIDLSNVDPESDKIVKDFEDHMNDLSSVICTRKTRTGYAMVTEPCNPNDIDFPDCTELKKDSYLYVGILND
jgi:hypothetical protein